DLAGPVLADGHGFGRPGVGPGRRAGFALLERVPVTEGQVVEVAAGDLLAGDDDIVVVGAAGDREGAMDQADLVRRRIRAGSFDMDVGERTVRRALRREDRAVD